MPTVSVVIPVLNDADMLRRCLEALAEQTVPADEVVVVDNGSTDGSAAVALAGGARLVAEPRRGIPQAVSTGLDAAQGQILARLDADSVPPPDWVARLVEAFEAEFPLDALSGPGRFYGGNRFVRWFGEKLYIGTYATLVSALFGHDVLFGSNMALQASAWKVLRESMHRDDATVHDDLDLAINLVPGMRVSFDRTLVVGVSARPFASWSGFCRRVGMALHTFAVNHREESLLARRRAWKAAVPAD